MTLLSLPRTTEVADDIAYAEKEQVGVDGRPETSL